MKNLIKIRQQIVNAPLKKEQGRDAFRCLLPAFLVELYG